MGRSGVGVAWYCLRATFRARRRQYAALAVLVALVGGLGMASIAGARRTQSSFPELLAASDSSQVEAFTGVINPLLGSNVGYNPHLIDEITRLPHVRRVGSQVGLDVLPVDSAGRPIAIDAFPPAAGNGLGSVNGESFTQDRLRVVAGRLADPARSDEIDLDQQVARVIGWRIGQRVRMGVYTNQQTNLPDFGTAKVRPYRVETVTVVGYTVQPHQVVEDDVDDSQSLAYFTPAFTAPYLSCCVNYTVTTIRVTGAAPAVASVAAAVKGLLPKLAPTPSLAAPETAKAERAIEPESIALGVFGGIVALAALLIAIQMIGRQLRSGRAEAEGLRAIGADPLTTSGHVLLGTVAALAAGSILAAAVAIGLSPLAPLGPVRRVDPSAGVSFDWTVLGLGVLALVAVPLLATVVMLTRAAPHRGGRRVPKVAAVSVAARAAAGGLPAPAVMGVHFALEPGAADAVPVRSAIVGAALAALVVVSTVTFGSSLNALVSHPPLYGWNWDYALVAGGGSGNMPQAAATRLLDADPYVRQWSGVYFDDLAIDGVTVPVMGEDPGAAVQPPVLTGHGLAGSDQAVLGAITLAQLHKQVGDTVSVDTGAAHETLRIVGTATMPTLGGPGPHLEMGVGAVVPSAVIPAGDRNPFHDPQTGPEVALIRVSGPIPPSAILPSEPGVPLTGNDPAIRSLDRIGGQLSNNFNFGVGPSAVQRPAEIVNYRSLGTTPAVLGGGLAAGSVAALALTLVASVRRRRRDLALLKTLGFTNRQLAATIAWQSSVSVGLGAIVGVPLGIVVGRALWTLFADQIHAVPSPSVPVLYVVLIAAGALVLANAVASVPGRMAARTPTGLLLREA